MQESSAPADIDTTAIQKSPELVYGIPVNTYKEVKGKIKSNRFLSDILLPYGISYSEINTIIEHSKSIFDVRKMIAGHNYTIYCDTIPDLKARYFLYEHDAVTNYIISFNDSLNITEFRKEPSKSIRYVSGIIKTSLWESMIANHVNPLLAVELSEIFAWTVDFFGLQKGDEYKIIYEEEFIEGKSIGISKIYGAMYTWANRTFTAIPFIQDSVESFYDVDGNSLRKTFLKAPLRFSRISSRFSSGRMHPVLKIVRPHYGVDYAAPLGTPVVAIGDGRVISATYDKASGKKIKIKHNSVYTTAYLHLSRFANGLKAGKTVKQGEIIGYVGSTGLATGPHLDFRFYVNGSPVDPLKVESPSVDPVHEENMENFKMIKTIILRLLETIPSPKTADDNPSP